MRDTVLTDPTLDGGTLSARFIVGGQGSDLYIRSDDTPLADGADPFVIASLLPAMRAGAPFVVEGPVSPRLLAALPEVQSIIASWIPQLREVEIRAEAREGKVPRGEGTAAFFSLGTDSFFTVVKKKEELTHLLSVRGFDPKELAPDLWDRISRNCRRVAAQNDLSLIEVETNLRSLGGRAVDWRWMHGPALIAVAHASAAPFGTIYMSASQTGSPLGPWGSHPLLDPLWSTERLDIVHFGSLSRVQKLLAIQDHPLVLETLRVCQSGDGHAYNCGRCRKCLLAMTILAATNRLQSSETFPHQIDAALFGRLNLWHPSQSGYFREALGLLRAAGGDPALVRAIEWTLRRGAVYCAARQVVVALRQLRHDAMVGRA